LPTEDLQTLETAEQLFQQGFQQFQARQWQAAIETWQQALLLYRSSAVRAALPDSWNREVQLLLGIGRSYDMLMQPTQAVEFYRQGWTISQEIGDQASEITFLNNIGSIHRNAGEYAEAMASYEQALTITRRIGDRAGESIVLNNIGSVNRLMGQYPQAIEQFQSALTLVQALNDRVGEGRTLSNLGAVYESLGQYRVALQQYEQALTIRREVGDRAGEAITLNNIGSIYNQMGQYPQALATHHQALTIRQDVGDQAGEASTFNNLAAVYGNLGQYQLALQNFAAALAIAEQVGDRAGMATGLNNLGWVYQALGETAQALEQYQQALVIQQALGDRAGEADTINNLGAVYNDLRQFDQALEQFQQALAIIRSMGDRFREGVALNNIGWVYSQQGQYTAALEQYEQALTIRREVSDRAGEADTLTNLGMAQYQIQQYDAAEVQLEQALNRLESLRAAELSDTQKIAIFEQQSATYQLLQQVLIAQNDPEKTQLALMVAERGRSRPFVELLTNTLQTRLPMTHSSEISEPELVSRTPDIPKIRQIAQQQNATLVQYSVIENEVGSALYIWVVPPAEDIQFRKVDLSRIDQPLHQLVATSRSAIGAEGRSTGTITVRPTAEAQQQQAAQAQQALHQLYQLLIEPIRADLPQNSHDRIILIPQGDLFLVPFAALVDSQGQYLIQQHTILTAPSIQVLDLTRQQRQRISKIYGQLGQPLVVGNPIMPALWDPNTGQTSQLPPLAGAEQESIAIASAIATQPLLRQEATETIVKQRMPQARMIHLATHGLLDYGDPNESGVRDLPGAIALAPSDQDDGLLTSREIYEMALNAEFVVLSACDTGRGNITGDGVIGLSRSLMQAGVPSVIVSLWAVPDEPTAQLMTQFYQNLQQTSDKAQALRQAMLTTMQQYPDPINWAAFILIGEAE
jgi:CHAT domain-containing protein